MLDKAFSEFEDSIKKPEISMTPIIDMVFILLIFFVVATTYTKETGISVDKAKASTSKVLNNELMLIAIDKNGNYWYDSKNRTLDELISIAVSATSSDNQLKLVLIPDKNGRIEPMITLMDHLRAQGVQKFSIGTQLVQE